MAPKKKKTQLKPVARGFATTSVPKKVVEPPKELETPDSKDEASALPGKQPATNTLGAKAVEPSSLSTTDQALQNLIDKFQDKAEKDIVRTIKVRAFYKCGV